MENLQFTLLIFQVVIAVAIIFFVLIQKSDGDSLGGIGGGNGGMNSAVSARSSANFLTKLTMTLSALFMLNCLVLAVISSKINKSSNLEIDKVINLQNNSSTNK